MKENSLSLRKICVIAILGSLSAILMLFDFPIFIAPSFYKLDISDVPSLIGALSMGPGAALLIQVVRILIKLLLKPTSSAFVGELAAFLFSSVYCVSAGYLYQKNRNRKNLIITLIISSLLMTIAATAGNYFFIIPAYVNLYHISLETIIAMGNAIFGIVNSKLTFVLCCVLPFNLIKATIVDVIVILCYERLLPIINGMDK